MAFDPFASDSPLIVYVDFKSPYAYVAVAPTRALAAELGIEIDWRPLTLDIPSYLGSAKLGADGSVVESQRSASQWSAVRYAYKDARRYGALAGLTVRGTTKIWDSTLAGMGLEWAKAQGAPVLARYMDLVYERFWRRELDIEDVAVIEAVLAAAGADAKGFADHARADRARFEVTQREIFEAGIFGVPGYVLEGDYYWGREHLPRIRWQLAGRTGAAPDVAYRRVSPSGAREPSESPSSRAVSAVKVCIDFTSAHAWLAIEPTRALERRLGVAFDWMPLRVPVPARPGVASPAESRGARHRRIRAEYHERDLARYARARGIALGDVHRAPDAALASLGLVWLRARAPELAGAYVERMFERIWRDGADPASAAVVEGTLTSLGSDPAAFRADVATRGAAPLEALQAELGAAGLFGVPAYVVEGEPFVGRQHLPMIEWRIGGRTGAPPI
jgi:2-hydroxychromene-2-carboxylate isomerase